MKKIKAITIALLFLSNIKIHAQRSTNSAGGEASGTGGSSHFSVGQPLYAQHTGTAGSVTAGVQQTYDISVVTGHEIHTIQLKMTVHPNPTIENIALTVNDHEGLHYQLHDAQGNALMQERIIQEVTHITLDREAAGAYFLEVRQNNQHLKTFKIIKN